MSSSMMCLRMAWYTVFGERSPVARKGAKCELGFIRSSARVNLVPYVNIPRARKAASAHSAPASPNSP